MPFQSSAENAAFAATDIINSLQHPSRASPYDHIGDQQMEALQQLAEKF